MYSERASRFRLMMSTPATWDRPGSMRKSTMGWSLSCHDRIPPNRAAISVDVCRVSPSMGAPAATRCASSLWLLDVRCRPKPPRGGMGGMPSESSLS